MSQTNPTTVNGLKISDIVVLQDGDNIIIGDRQFLFQAGNYRIEDELSL